MDNYITRTARELGVSHLPALSAPSDKEFFMHLGDRTRISSALYARFVGCLTHVSRCRMDIKKESTFLARSLKNPTVSDMHKVIRVWQYLSGSSACGPTYYTENGVQMITNVDAAFAVHVDGMSQSGGFNAIGIGNSPISCYSKAQLDVALSPCASEYYGLSDIVQMLLWHRNFLNSLGFLQSTTIVYEDSVPTIGLVYSPIVTRKARYMFVRHHFVRELARTKIIKVVHVQTEDQTADLFTHPLCPKQFKFHLSRLFNYSSIPNIKVACSALAFAAVMSHGPVRPPSSLIIRPSSKPRAGLGLYTSKDIRMSSHTYIGQYRGDIFYNELDMSNIQKDYAVHNDSIYISAWNEDRMKPCCKAAYINDPLNEDECNVECYWIGNLCYIRPIRDIEAGEELFMAYGFAYWMTRRHGLLTFRVARAAYQIPSTADEWELVYRRLYPLLPPDSPPDV
jgi:hypothetical protein